MSPVWTLQLPGATSGKLPISDYLQMLKLVFALLSQGGNGTRNEHGEQRRQANEKYPEIQSPVAQGA